MKATKPYNLLVVIVLLIIFGPMYLFEILNLKFFATAKLFNIPAGGFLIWIYHLVGGVLALVLVAIINARERT